MACQSNDPHVKKLWELWRLSGLTMGELTDKVGVDRATVSSWFRGTTQPTLANIEACFNALNFTLEVIPAGELDRLKKLERMYAELNISKLLELKDKVKALTYLV